jgi:hypothetical protein
MIIVKLIGGLGNQMFQYAIGRHIAEKNNIEFKLDITEFEIYDLHKYSLNHFNIIEKLASNDEIYKFNLRKNFEKIFNKINLYSGKKYIKEKKFAFNEKLLKIKNNAYIDGYWQSEKYFKKIENIIRKEFVINKAQSAKNKEVTNMIKECNSISIHIRRGDYINNKHTSQLHNTCGLDYYNRTIDYINKNNKNPHFFVFSDDPQWAKDNLKTELPIYFIDNNNVNTNYEDLRLMSQCNHNIIANSSFSWWGAWLNNNPDKIVIFPRTWFNDRSIETKDLIPKKWTAINNAN